MKYLANILICCLLTATLCGCQAAKTPATLSSTPSAISKEDVESISNAAEIDSSVASKETNTSVSETIDSSSYPSTESSNNSVSSQKLPITSNSSGVSNTSKLPAISSEDYSSKNICYPRHIPDFERINDEEPDLEFLEWTKNRYLSNYTLKSKEDGEFLLWAGTQKGILMPKVDNGFESQSVDVECEGTLRYEMVYYSQNKNRDMLYFVLYPIMQEDQTSKALLDLIKKYNYRTGKRETKYKKGKDACTWGTYYIETSYFGTVWFLHNNYLISCEYKNKFDAEVFKLIDFEIKEFEDGEDGFYTEQDFVDWVKTNRKTSKASDFGYSLLNSLKSKSEIMLPNIALDGFSLKKVYPITHQNIYKAVFTSAKPVNGIESIEFEIQSFQNTNKHNAVFWVDNDYPEEKSLSKSKRSYEYVESEDLEDKCNYGFYVKAKKQPIAYFSHKDFAVKITVNLKEKSGGFKEEYFDLFDIEYISLDQ